jgi:hypothetical protein
MERKRKIEKVVRKVSFAEAEDSDLFYWADKTIRERLTEVNNWNKKVWMQILKDNFSEKIIFTGGKQKKQLTDEDDF